MKISKHYDETLSHRFPSGDIATIRLGTFIEVDTVLDTASEEDIVKLSTKLFKRSYKLTKKDIKSIIKNDKLAQAVYEGIQTSVENMNDEEEARQVLEQDD
jgi:ArsR family metal-binding transcriptional regulator